MKKITVNPAWLFSLLILLIFINGCEKISGKDPCTNIETGEYGPYMKEECYYNLALEKNKENLCKKAGERIEECERKVKINKAVESRNHKNCFKIGEIDYDIADCVSQIAVIKKDKSICDNLPDFFGNVLGECHAKVAISTNDLPLCEKTIGTTLDDECYKKILEKSKDPTQLCKTVSSVAFTYCIRNIDCEKTEDIVACSAFVIEEQNNPEICESQLNEGEKTGCYTALAIKLNNKDLCFKAQKNICLTKFAIEKKMPEICELTEDSCYTSYGRAYNDINICNKMKESLNVDSCFREFAIKNNDLELCNKIKGDTTKKGCYNSIAYQLKDPSLCVLAGEFEKDCLWNIENN